MVQTLTVRTDETVEINTGKNAFQHEAFPFTDALEEKLNQIKAVLASEGASQLHAEKDTFRQFEHINVAGEVLVRKFGATVSASDFDWIMQHVDAEIEARELAEQQAALEAQAAAVTEPPVSS